MLFPVADFSWGFVFVRIFLFWVFLELVEVVTFFSKAGFGVQASFATSAGAPSADETKHPLSPL